MSLLRNRFAEGYPALAYIAEVRDEFASRADVTVKMAGRAIGAAGFDVPDNRITMLVIMTGESFEQLRAAVFGFFERNAAPLLRRTAGELSDLGIGVEDLWGVASAEYAAFQDGRETLRDAADLAAGRLGVEADFMRGFFQDLHAEFNRSMFSSPFLAVAISNAFHGHDRRPVLPVQRG